MTYYEELGVGPDASTAEIRTAYLQLAKLLHPDTQPDERLRRLAACQMQRLNRVYETLSSADARRAYDRSLQAAPMLPVAALPPAPVLPPGWKRQALVWGGAFALGGILMFVISLSYGTAPPPPSLPPPRPEPSAVVRAPQRTTGNQPVPLPAKLRATEPVRLPHRADPPRVPLIELPQPVEVAAIAQTAQPPRRPPSAPEPRFAGVWYLASRPPTPVSGMYAPEYIEARIEEHSGRFVGRYRSRYLVPDRAISPEVSFQFEGPGAEPDATLPWHGPQGARGELRLRLLSANTLEVVWLAADLGGVMGLASGKAILIRSLVP